MKKIEQYNLYIYICKYIIVYNNKLILYICIFIDAYVIYLSNIYKNFNDIIYKQLYYIRIYIIIQV